jgi:hypothetical protein
MTLFDVRSRAVSFLAAGALLALACQGRLFTIRVRDEATTTVARGSVIEQIVGDMGFGDFLEMDLTQSQELRNQGVEPGDIASAELTRFTLRAAAPEGADLAFLQSMSLFVEGPGLPRALLARADAFPEGEPEVAFELTGADLTDYVVSRSMTFTTEVRGRRPSVDTQVAAAFEVRVGVTRQGACNQVGGD